MLPGGEIGFFDSLIGREHSIINVYGGVVSGDVSLIHEAADK
jgi:hypothetical protein